MKFGKMKSHRRNQLLLIGFLVFGSGTALALALTALNENINLFYAPDQIVAGEAPVDQMIRAGGMVKTGSIVRSTSDLKVRFVISDMQTAEVTVQYEGVLPDLFREGQGVVARGELNRNGVFMAEEVLAKHDEEYMPPEVIDALADAHDKAQAL
ncbi:MAG: cytochrome c-type biogenesis protein CcmE [Candidatus Azotimanducaceae bacterium]|jgi:cytochrome c-type biogenesis protein CcmE